MAPAPSEIPAQLRAYARSTAFGAYATGVLAAWELHAQGLDAPGRARVIESYKRRLARDTLRVLGVRWELVGPRARGARGRLVVANHRSALDIGVMLAEFGGSLVSRGDLAEWPVLGRLARHGGTIFVERGEARSGAAAIRAMRRKLAEGNTVVIFPEGTVHPGDEVQPFQGGAFAAARGLDVEVVPVGLAYDVELEWRPKTSFGAHVFDLAGKWNKSMVGHVGEPFRPEGSAARVAAEARDAVQALVDRSRARLERRA